MLKRFIVRILGCALGIALAARYVNGVEVVGSAGSLFLAGLVLAALISFLDPLLKIITFPLRLLTLNLFGLVIDMAMVWITQAATPGFNIEGLLALFLATFIVYLTNAILWIIISPLLKS
jgi:putative membrane protein